jgi:hypothetical protein
MEEFGGYMYTRYVEYILQTLRLFLLGDSVLSVVVILLNAHATSVPKQAAIWLSRQAHLETCIDRCQYSCIRRQDKFEHTLSPGNDKFGGSRVRDDRLEPSPNPKYSPKTGGALLTHTTEDRWSENAKDC